MIPHVCVFHVDGIRFDEFGGTREHSLVTIRVEARIVQGAPNHFAECSLSLQDASKLALLGQSSLLRTRLTVVALDGGTGTGDSHSNFFELQAR